MYDPIFWKDHFVEYVRRYSMTQGESAGLVYLHPAPGEVEQQGTPQNAANFTRMDYGILEQAIMTNFLYVSTKHYAETLSEVKDYAYGVYEQSTGYTDKRIADLIGAPPETLDTIEKLADALKENEDVVNAINAAIVKKANQSVLETHMNNEYIHVDADKQEKWNGYEQQIADLNSNLTQVSESLSVIGGTSVTTVTLKISAKANQETEYTLLDNMPKGTYIISAVTHVDNAPIPAAKRLFAAIASRAYTAATSICSDNRSWQWNQTIFFKGTGCVIRVLTEFDFACELRISLFLMRIK